VNGTLGAFVATTRPEHARTFYRDTLGLRLVSEDSFALVFEAGATILRVQKVPAFTPHPFTALGWNVSDVTAEVRALAAKGVAFERYGFFEQDPDAVWTAPDGAKVAWFKDPDGNTLSLAQPGRAPR
jgi:catechol 2,3-dioxygenase-like lactoylglutathione lyase family enzyme